MRRLCLRCLRPTSACFCRVLPPIVTRTEVVIVQHPRERRVAIGTVRLLAAALTRSRVVRDVSADSALAPWLSSASAHPESADAPVALLYPGAGSRPSSDFRALQTLVVVDGTWPQARKLLRLNPGLAALPRVGFVSRIPSNYRIRKEPAEHCLSTLEAVTGVLSELEGDAAPFQPLVEAFTGMVDHQLACAARRLGPSRRRVRVGPPRPRIPAAFSAAGARLVLVMTEANAHPAVDGRWNPPELVHLCAVRPATGARLELRIRPRRPLAEAIPDYIGVSRAALEGGVSLPDARARFQEFLGEAPLVASWGVFGARLLVDEGLLPHEPMDLRQLVTAVERRTPGALEDRFQGVPPLGEGRAGQRLGFLAAVADSLLTGPQARVA